MKVFLVRLDWGLDGDGDNTIAGVFSTIEKAKKVFIDIVRNKKENSYFDIYFDEHGKPYNNVEDNLDMYEEDIDNNVFQLCEKYTHNFISIWIDEREVD